VLGSAGCASSRVVENSNGHGKGSSIVSDESIVITECEFKQVEGDREHPRNQVCWPGEEGPGNSEMLCVHLGSTRTHADNVYKQQGGHIKRPNGHSKHV